jgi:putative transposase
MVPHVRAQQLRVNVGLFPTYPRPLPFPGINPYIREPFHRYHFQPRYHRNVPYGLKRYHESKQTHFITFSCYRRLRLLTSASLRQLFLNTLEEMRTRFEMRVYGYVLMPEHVHLLISEPDHLLLSNAIHWLKLTFSKRSAKFRDGRGQPFWQARYYDHNVTDYEKFVEKLRYIHRNPVKRGFCDKPEDWAWSSFRHYSDGEVGPVEIESERTAKGRAVATHRTDPG